MPAEINPGMYKRVFEDHHEGKLIFEDLVKRFGRNPWVPGGPEAARETDRRLGMRAVVEHITTQINRSQGIEDEEPNNE